MKSKKNLKLQTIFLTILYQLLFLPVIYLSVSRISPFLEHFETFDSSKNLVLITTLIFSCFFYILSFLFLSKRKYTLNFLTTLILISPLYIAILSIQPLLSRDIYVYAVNGRNSCEYNVNPYTQNWNISNVSSDKWVSLLNSGWGYTGPSPYGPLFNLLNHSVGCLSENIFIVSFILKMIMFAAFILVGYILYKEGNNEESKNNIAFLYLLNPALIVHFLLEGHNNILGILIILLALKERSEIKSWVLYALSTMIRYTYITVAPAFLIINRKIKVRTLIIAFLSFLIVTLVLYAPYSYPFKEIFLSIKQITQLHCLYQCSFIWNFLYKYLSINSQVGLILFVLIYVFLIYKFLFKSSDPRKFITLSYISFLFLTVKWLAPWYFMLPLVLSISTSKGRRDIYIILLITLYSFYRYNIL